MCDYVQKNFCIDFFASIFTAIYPFSPSESEWVWILNCSDFSMHSTAYVLYRDITESEEENLAKFENHVAF